MTVTSFATGGRLRYAIFAISLIALLYMITVLHEDLRALVSYNPYSESSLFTSANETSNSSSTSSNSVLAAAEGPITTVDTTPRPLYQPEGKANATLVFLARNSDLPGVLKSMRSMEAKFNHRFGYPWVFLNEEEFTDEFKVQVTALTSAPVHFGLIPAHHWYQPEWIDEERAERARDQMKWWGVIYADSVPYRNMCRFNSGYFFQHPLLQAYKFYWRVEPDVEYFCDINYDPFDYLKENNKTYGFTIALTELERTIPTLWPSVKEFTEQYPEYVAQNNAMRFLSDDGGNSYNLCHFWSNFEIADMDFWRGEAYTKFFEFLDSKGGFYYERWGDAPIHSIAAALFLDKSQLHFFGDMGYSHSNLLHCPLIPEQYSAGSCTCNRRAVIDYGIHSCLPRYNLLSV